MRFHFLKYNNRFRNVCLTDTSKQLIDTIIGLFLSFYMRKGIGSLPFHGVYTSFLFTVATNSGSFCIRNSIVATIFCPAIFILKGFVLLNTPALSRFAFRTVCTQSYPIPIL